MDPTLNHILQKYHISPGARLSGGMEAEVYAHTPETVLKVYQGTAKMAELLTLQAFYNALDRQLVPYALPQIHAVHQEGPFLVTLERRLSGVPMSSALPDMPTHQMDQMMHRYLSAALAVSNIRAPAGLERYKLFDQAGVSSAANGDWHHFLANALDRNLHQVSPYLSRDVAQFGAKYQQLRDVLDPPYQGDYRLIHGDFFPGNLLINAAHEITALLDFGLLTMYGDYWFDLATGWVFFDMYDELHAQLRDRYLAMLLERLGNQARGKLYRYILIYSILGANIYSPTCADGHYQWCVANLNHSPYWEGLA